MGETQPIASLDDKHFDLLRDLINRSSGMQFADNKKYLLEARLQTRLRARSLKSFQEYYYFLKFDPRKQEEFTALYNEITTNETSFFRHMPQLIALERNVLPEIVARKNETGERTLRLWSAACSSGEEAYTLGMILKEVLGSAIARWRIEIVASDISTEMLEKGKAGIYGEYTMRSTPLAMRRKYFTRLENGDFQTNSDLRATMRFQHLNFSDDAGMKRMTGFDVIFCRNVLIYFDLEARKKFVEHFYNALNTNGYLFVGHSESLHNVTRAFKLAQLPNAFAYKKEGG